MKYYLDTEFHEYHKQQKCFGIKIRKPIPTIDLISIGIVSEDIQREVPYGGDTEDLKKVITNKEYYAICKDFNLVDAWCANQGTKENPNYWLKDNVLKSIWKELEIKDNKWDKNTTLFTYTSNPISNSRVVEFNYFRLKYLINKYGKTKKQITKEILEFINEDIKVVIKETNTSFKGESNIIYESKPEFYAYYADYDWVVFAQLFGTMMDLPKGFPMYCKDLKQEIDRKVDNKRNSTDRSKVNVASFDVYLKGLKNDSNYPKQNNEHNALADAKWNKKLHKFLNTI